MKKDLLNVIQEDQDAKMRSLFIRAREYHDRRLKGFRLTKDELQTIYRVHSFLLLYFQSRKDLFPGTVHALEVEQEWITEELNKA